jgi:hypothetical protein
MDKSGSCIFLLSFGTIAEMQWSSASKKKNQLLWRWTRFCILTAVEVWTVIPLRAASGDIMQMLLEPLCTFPKKINGRNNGLRKILFHTTKYARDLKF